MPSVAGIIWKYLRYLENSPANLDWADLPVFNSSEFQINNRHAAKLNQRNIDKPFMLYSSTEKKEPFRRLNRHAFTDLYDVTIKCSNNMEIKAHKCVLVARLEYFSLMFSHSWAEVSVFRAILLSYFSDLISVSTHTHICRKTL